MSESGKIGPKVETVLRDEFGVSKCRATGAFMFESKEVASVGAGLLLSSSGLFDRGGGAGFPLSSVLKMRGGRGEIKRISDVNVLPYPGLFFTETEATENQQSHVAKETVTRMVLTLLFCFYFLTCEHLSVHTETISNCFKDIYSYLVLTYS